MIKQDFVDLLKQDGSHSSGIRSTVDGSDLIVVEGNQHLIEIGDLIQRALTTGAVETYRVEDPQFYEHGLVGKHYQLKVRKLGLFEAGSAVQHITAHNRLEERRARRRGLE